MAKLLNTSRTIEDPIVYVHHTSLFKSMMMTLCMLVVAYFISYERKAEAKQKNIIPHQLAIAVRATVRLHYSIISRNCSCWGPVGANMQGIRIVRPIWIFFHNKMYSIKLHTEK